MGGKKGTLASGLSTWEHFVKHFPMQREASEAIFWLRGITSSGKGHGAQPGKQGSSKSTPYLPSQLPLPPPTPLPHTPCPRHTRFLSAHPCSPYIEHAYSTSLGPPAHHSISCANVTSPKRSLIPVSTWTSPLPLVTLLCILV